MVNHWTKVTAPDIGDVFYVYMFFHHSGFIGNDVDPVTGLYGKTRLTKYINNRKKDRGLFPNKEYAIVYLNLTRFKLLNIEKGADEGDECLRQVACVLQDTFTDSFVARISDDHFAVFCGYEDVLEKAEAADRSFHDSYGSHNDVICKFGIYKINLNYRLDVETALSLAKLACDYIKNSDTNVAEYSKDLAKKIRTQRYIVDRFDEALEKGWIQVYYQPVIRSITGYLCGMESLVRWIDPYEGFLRPDQFISTLEDEHLIHKLDAYMVEQVCAYIRERLSTGLPMVPVSVNFSRLDFILCDMLDIVEKAVRKNEIPRDYIHIEITESMIASDENLMRNIIDSFQNAGYEVWMDDFGSGYSSLNLLKDYRFDMLKLDMRFLTPFTDRSRSIVTATVGMAKDIGIMTLAEGVETQEQLDFLREIGCSMIQGYYYGKPEPPEQVFAHMEEKGIHIGIRKWRHLYDVVGKNIRATDYPLEIIEDDGTNFRTLFMNQPYKEQIKCEGMSLEAIDARIYNRSSALWHRFRDMASKIEVSDHEEVFYYTINGNYFCFKGLKLTESYGRYIIRGSLTNISRDSLKAMSDRLDTKLRELNNLFEAVLLYDLKQNTVTPLLGTNKYMISEGGKPVDLKSDVEKVIRRLIHPDDHRRCLAFLDVSSIGSRVDEAGRGYIEDVFRLKQPDGSYQWTEHYMLRIPDTSGNEYLCCLKPFTDKNTDRLEAITELFDKQEILGQLEAQTIDYSEVLSSILNDTPVKFFWKDTGRRFLGASKAFLEYFNISDISEIIGKTDEDMGWHIDPGPHINNEEIVILKGETVGDVFGKCIVNGIVHTIRYTKIPLYRRGVVCGLVGHFVDWEEERARVLNEAVPLRLDPVTGVLNSHAFVDTIIDYAEEYHDYGHDYALLVFNNVRHTHISEAFGEDFSGRVLRAMAEALTANAGNGCAIARTKGSIFTLVTHLDTKEKVEALRVKLTECLEAITEVDGNRVTIRIKSFAKLRSTIDISDEAIYEEALKAVSGF